MTFSERLRAVVEPVLETMGYEAARVSMRGETRKTLQIMAERKDGAAMTVDDCAALSRALSAALDVEDPIAGSYALEISSPGVDRPLTRKKHFVDWTGFDAKIETKTPIDGRKRFTGALMGLSEDQSAVRLRGEREEDAWTVPVDMISSAKLVLTAALIEAVAKKHPGV